MSVFVLDASYALPWVWQLEVSNVLGKAVVKGKVPLPRAIDIWNELTRLPIRQMGIGTGIPELLRLAVEQNLSVYDTCYLQASLVSGIPLAINNHDLQFAAEACGNTVLSPCNCQQTWKILCKNVWPVAPMRTQRK